MTNSKPDALPVGYIEAQNTLGNRDAELAELREQNRILRSGLKGDFDLDSWLVWAKGKKAMEAELTTLRARLAELEQQKTVQADCVGVMREDAEGGLRVEWLLEGDTAELMAGMYLFCLDGGDCLFEDGSGQLYAAPSQVAAEVVQVEVPETWQAQLDRVHPTIQHGKWPKAWCYDAMEYELTQLRALLAASQEQAK